MNFGFNPVSNYLSKNGMEISDWGIEENASTPTLSTHSNFPPQRNFPDHEEDFQYYYQKNDNQIIGSTENFSKYIKKYLSMESLNEVFWEKFKYNLIVSDLLDDSMVLSKNEQALSTLLSNLKKQKLSYKTHHLPTYINSLNFDGTQLKIVDKKYELRYSTIFNKSNYLLLVINLIIFLLKQCQLSKIHHHKIIYLKQLKMFKVLLIISTKLVKFRKFKLLIYTNRTKNYLDDFLVSNYQLNKKLISNLILVKELEMFNFLDKSQHDAFKQELKDNVLNALSFITFDLKTAITKLIPFMNGDLLEQYCTINNINLNILNQSFENHLNGTIVSTDPEDQHNQELEEITFNINKFNQLRKFLICQFLTINDAPIKKTYFIYKLTDIFHIEENFNHDNRTLTSIQKLSLLEKTLSAHNQVLHNFITFFDNYDKSSSKKLDKTQDLSVINNVEEMKDDNLITLIHKLDKLTTNLKFFHKYNQSTKSLNNIDEMQEKLEIFNQFNDELNAVKELYQVNMNDLNNEMCQRNRLNLSLTSPRSTFSDSGCYSPSSEPFGLKSFQNSSIKKRYSLPSSIKSNSPHLDEKLETERNVASSGKKYKHLSTGLQLGLLTVFEDPTKKGKTTRNPPTQNTSSSSARPGANYSPVSYDDNYINMLPPTGYESYNQSTLDQLSNSQAKKLSFGNLRNSNRFSLNSVNSTVSGLTDFISSTHLTCYDDDDDGLVKDSFGSEKNSLHISKEELKLKLEESFNRIYNLESENNLLKLNENSLLKLNERVKPIHPVPEDNTINHSSKDNKIINHSKNNKIDLTTNSSNSEDSHNTFLSELESKLHKKVGSFD
jgi:hypothetical protein